MKITRRRVLASMIASGAGLGVYAWRVEPRWLAVVRRDLPLKNLAPELVGKTLVQLSDLHIGTRVDESYLRRQFEYVKTLDPDFIFYTGDFIDFANRDHVERLKQQMPYAPLGKLGTAGVIGNHDYLGGYAKPEIAMLVESHLTDLGIQILRDEMVELSGLTVAGLEDLWSPTFHIERSKDVVKSLPTGSVVLAHNPDTADKKIWPGFDGWILCGHTHGGQCRIPLVGAPFVPVHNKTYVAGEYVLGQNRRMYINRGVGHTTRVRFNSRPEITVFTLRAVS